MKLAQKFLALYVLFLLVNLTLGCTTAWTSEASGIITLLVPAIESAIAILAAFGLGISPTVLTAVQKWAAESVDTLNNVIKPLIDKFNAAEESAKPGILTEIETAVSTVLGGLNSILPAIHVTDPAVQFKITAVITAVQLELTALLNLIPVIQGTVTGHDTVKARIVALKSPDHFKNDFNTAVAPFGKKYEIGN
jgi:hypothetical protein